MFYTSSDFGGLAVVEECYGLLPHVEYGGERDVHLSRGVCFGDLFFQSVFWGEEGYGVEGVWVAFVGVGAFD